MTTSRRAAANPAPAKQAAEAETVPDGTIAEDEQELLQDIERTREQLSETVDQLAAKTHVKARAQAKAVELARRVKAANVRAQAKAADRSAGVRGQVTATTAIARHKATAGRDQLQTRVALVWEAAPEPLRRTVSKGAATVRQRWVPLAAAAATLVTGYLGFRWWRRR